MTDSLVIRHENDEFQFRFTHRNYGRKTYTWAEVNIGGTWHDCGDPWPCATPKRRELIAAAQGILQQVCGRA